MLAAKPARASGCCLRAARSADPGLTSIATARDDACLIEQEVQMARYVMLLNWTEQGVKNAKDTVKRAAAARQAFEKGGAQLREIYWTLGQYDLVLIAEAPSDESITALSIQLGALGNV